MFGGMTLKKLEKLLASRRQDFSLAIAPQLARLDALFSELRYPKALTNVALAILDMLGLSDLATAIFGESESYLLKVSTV